MTNLQTYIEPLQTELFNRLGCFFAYSKKQYEEQAIKGINYTIIGAGLLIPSSAVKSFETAHANLVTEAVKQCLAKNTIEELIHYELANYETQLTGNISDAVKALEPLGITREQVQAEYGHFYQHCIDNDYF